ncbi:hypothetical protein [uncultured Gammaproteobacteria bacterium]|nr:hypothetical protein [uncultured Gammaproteobacteria bacterium]
MKKMKKINALVLAGMLSMPIYAEKIPIETGIGVNYGGNIGANISKPINSEIELFAGAGIIGSKVGYTAGGRYYINDSIRLIANYGTNASVGEIDGTTVFKGLNFGVDHLSASGWTVGLMYSDTSKAEDRVEELEREGYTFIKPSSGKIKISLGYRW